MGKANFTDEFKRDAVMNRTGTVGGSNSQVG